jgi:hypothetical protein
MGAIVCTFHVGRHLRIPRTLALLWARVCLVLDSANFQRSATFRTRAPTLDHSESERFGAINTETRLGAFQILKRLERGDLLFVYADGNSGTGSQRPLRSSDLRLFDLPVRTKFGFLEIAHLAGAPVHFLLDVRTPGRGFALQHLEQFQPASHQSPREFAEDVAHKMLSQFEAMVRERPDLWEEWHQLPWWIDFKALVSNGVQNIRGIRFVQPAALPEMDGLAAAIGDFMVVADRRTGAIYCCAG